GFHQKKTIKLELYPKEKLPLLMLYNKRKLFYEISQIQISKNIAYKSRVFFLFFFFFLLKLATVLTGSNPTQPFICFRKDRCGAIPQLLSNRLNFFSRSQHFLGFGDTQFIDKAG